MSMTLMYCHKTLINIREQPWVLALAFYSVGNRIFCFSQLCAPRELDHELLATPPPQF